MKIVRYFAMTLFAVSLAYGQSQNLSLFKQFNDYPSVGYSDCWGWVAPDGTEYALLGTDAGVSIVRLLPDPTFSGEVAFLPWVSGPWYDIKTYQNYMYVSSEFSNEVLIADLSFLPDSVSVVGSVGPFTTRPHNIYIETNRALLFVVEDNFAAKPVSIHSLADPLNPVELAFVGNDAHDVFAKDSLLFIAAGSVGRLDIYNIADPANPVVVQQVSIPSPGYVHNVWATEDLHYMLTTEETPNHTVKVWDIRDLQNVSLIGEYLGNSQLAHNVIVKNDYAFISHYESGIRVLDLSDPADPVEVAFYDTYPESESPNFNGAWGVYPFGNGGKIYGSDIQSGLYVLEFNDARAGMIAGNVTDADNNLPLSDVEIVFVEAQRQTVSDADGAYRLRTYGGLHTIVFSKPGYFSDTLQVAVAAGDTVIQNVQLTRNLAVASVSLDSIGGPMLSGTVDSLPLVISNIGPGGLLRYTIDDVVGPVTNLPTTSPITAIQSLRFENINIQSSSIRGLFNVTNGASGDTVLVDPAGDLLFGTGGDIEMVTAVQTANMVQLTFHFVEPVDANSLLMTLSLDTDFDISTGAFPGGFGFNLPEHQIGSEYDLIIDVPGFFAGGISSFYIWEGSNGQPSGNPIYMAAAGYSGNQVQIDIPLSAINDDGNMAIAGLSGHFSPSTGFISVDYYPNSGNGTVGVNPSADLPWLSLSRESGELPGGASDTVWVTLDMSDYPVGEELNGYLVVETNDIANPRFVIPVYIIVIGPLGIDDGNNLPLTVELAQNYPNPFNPTTTIRYALPGTEQVRLAVYNLLGQKIKTLVDGVQTAGVHDIVWDGKDTSGKAVGSGVYFYRLETDGVVKTRKMMLIR